MIMDLLLAGVLCLVAHEGGHFFVALVLGCKPKFRVFKWGMAVEFNWTHRWQNLLICEAGFGVAMLVGVALITLLGTPGAWVEKRFLLCYWALLTLHFWIYSWRAPDNTNDFNGLCSHMKEREEDGEVL